MSWAVHEFGLCESVLDAVERQAAGRRVTAMRIGVGTLHRVPQEVFDSAFEVMSAGSVAHGADVDFVVLPVRVHCRSCGQDCDVDDLLGTCPACGAHDVDSNGGDELVVQSISLEPTGLDSAGLDSAGMEPAGPPTADPTREGS